MFYSEKSERLIGHIGTKARGKQKSPKKKTPTFLLELPLVVEAGQAARQRAHLEAGRQFYNAVLSAGQRRLRQMRADPAWPYTGRFLGRLFPFASASTTGRLFSSFHPLSFPLFPLLLLLCWRQRTGWGKVRWPLLWP